MLTKKNKLARKTIRETYGCSAEFINEVKQAVTGEARSPEEIYLEEMEGS